MKHLSLYSILYVLLFAGICQADTVMSLNKITTEDDLINVTNYGNSVYALNWYQTASSGATTGAVAGVTFSNQVGRLAYARGTGIRCGSNVLQSGR